MTQVEQPGRCHIHSKSSSMPPQRKTVLPQVAKHTTHQLQSCISWGFPHQSCLRLEPGLAFGKNCTCGAHVHAGLLGYDGAAGAHRPCPVVSRGPQLVHPGLEPAGPGWLPCRKRVMSGEPSQPIAGLSSLSLSHLTSTPFITMIRKAMTAQGNITT